VHPTTGSLPELFLGTSAVQSGLLSRRVLRGPRVRRLVRGVYCAAGTAVTHELRCRAVALVAPSDAVVTGASALTVHGAALCEPWDPVHVVVPLDRRFELGRDVEVRRRLVAAHEVEARAGGPIATPLRAAVDLVLGRSALDVVPQLDIALHRGLVHREVLERELAGRSDRGVVLAREAVALADGRAESRPESWTRVVLVLAGLDPTPQHEVRDARGLVARVDLAFVAERVAVEYEGAHHGDQGWLVRDRQRLERLRQAGWVVVFVTRADLHRPHRELVARVRGALAA
jgi:hypothetical protein